MSAPGAAQSATLGHMTERERLAGLVQRIMDGDYSTGEEAERLVAEFQAGVLRPGASGLIFYWRDEFDHEPTAAEVVERALAYRPIEL
jgi:hypothetical protein